MDSALLSRNITINGLRTSLRLEKEIWEALDDICGRENISVHTLCSLIDKNRHGSSRTSAVRAFIVTYLRATAALAETANQAAAGTDKGRKGLKTDSLQKRLRALKLKGAPQPVPGLGRNENGNSPRRRPTSD